MKRIRLKSRIFAVFLVLIVLVLSSVATAENLNTNQVFIHTFADVYRQKDMPLFKLTRYEKTLHSVTDVQELLRGDILSIHMYATSEMFASKQQFQDFSGIVGFSVNIYKVDTCGTKILKTILKENYDDKFSFIYMISDDTEDGLYRVEVYPRSILNGQTTSIIEFNDNYTENVFFFAVGISDAKIEPHIETLGRVLLVDTATNTEKEKLIAFPYGTSFAHVVHEGESIYFAENKEDIPEGVKGFANYWGKTISDVEITDLDGHFDFETGMAGDRVYILNLAYVFEDDCIGEFSKCMIQITN